MLCLCTLVEQKHKELILIFKLPSISTMKCLTGKMQQRPKLNNFILNSDKISLNNINETDKMCILALKANIQYNIWNDDIIRYHDLGNYNWIYTGCSILYIEGDANEYKPAKIVLLFMARTINNNWKQHLEYFFLYSTCKSQDPKRLLFICIYKLWEAGAVVRGLIFDMG